MKERIMNQSDFEERISWWRTEKSRCERELINSRLIEDYVSAKNYEKEMMFCQERIDLLYQNRE